MAHSKKKIVLITEKQYATIEKAAAHCGVSLMTFRNYIRKYPDLPIKLRRHGGKGYQIDLKELDKWREENELLGWKSKGASELDAPVARVEKQKDRKERIQADLLELEYKKKSELLIEKDAVVKAFSTKIARLAQGLDRCATVIGYKMSLAPDVVEELHKMHDEFRLALLHDNEGWFTI